MPFWQVVPLVQTTPQPPQLFESELSFTHPAGHKVNPAVEQTHVLPEHCVPAGHAWDTPPVVHAPQLLLSVVVSVHPLGQLVRPVGHAHAPFWHVFEPVHLYWSPQPPQFGEFGWSFDISLTQLPLQRVVPLRHVCEHA